MMCSRAKELMAVSWEGELAGADARELEQHLTVCAECSMEAVSLGSLWNRLGDMPAPEPGRALDARWHSTLEALMAAQQPVGKQAPSASWFATAWANFWPRNPVWQAAIAMACLVAGVLIGQSTGR